MKAKEQTMNASELIKRLVDLMGENGALLLKDLCARLPYDVCANIRYKDGEPCYWKLTPRDIQWFIDSNIEVIKPYLRPMSSMTFEERSERIGLLWELEGHIDEDVTYKYQDWLNAHHLDYRELIERGLALEAPKGMYNLK